MRIIHKHQLLFESNTITIRLPKDANLLCVQEQKELPTLWAEVEADNPEETVTIFGTFTGKEFPSDAQPKKYLGTVQAKHGLVYHFFQLA